MMSFTDIAQAQVGRDKPKVTQLISDRAGMKPGSPNSPPGSIHPVTNQNDRKYPEQRSPHPAL